MVTIVEGMEDRILEASVVGHRIQDKIASIEGSHRYLKGFKSRLIVTRDLQIRTNRQSRINQLTLWITRRAYNWKFNIKGLILHKIEVNIKPNETLKYSLYLHSMCL